jgi:hypothetical protein
VAGTGEVYNKHRDIWEFGMSMEIFVYIISYHQISMICQLLFGQLKGEFPLPNKTAR